MYLPKKIPVSSRAFQHVLEGSRGFSKVLCTRDHCTLVQECQAAAYTGCGPCGRCGPCGPCGPCGQGTTTRGSRSDSRRRTDWWLLPSLLEMSLVLTTVGCEKFLHRTSTWNGNVVLSNCILLQYVLVISCGDV